MCQEDDSPDTCKAETPDLKGMNADMFDGFSPRTLDFMWNIRLNNNKEWFESHKEEFKREFQLPMKELGREVAKQGDLLYHRQMRPLSFLLSCAFNQYYTLRKDCRFW